jgi:hypothetical protein
MATVTITLNQLAGRDAALARRFENEIREAAAFGPDYDLACRILAWQRAWDLGSPDLVTVQFHLPGWVKVVAVSIGAVPGEVRSAVERALFPKFSETGPRRGSTLCAPAAPGFPAP